MKRLDKTEIILEFVKEASEASVMAMKLLVPRRLPMTERAAVRFLQERINSLDKLLAGLREIQRREGTEPE